MIYYRHDRPNEQPLSRASTFMQSLRAYMAAAIPSSAEAVPRVQIDVVEQAPKNGRSARTPSQTAL